MEKNLFRAYLVELIGTFILVFFAAGSVCVNHMTTPKVPQPEIASLNGQQPGLVGMALAQGLILAIVLTATLPISGGYLNPAITIMLWVFNRLDTIKAVWLLGAQVVGAVLAGLCIKNMFDAEVLSAARLGAPHLNPLAYKIMNRPALLAGTGIELILTFSLVLAIFSIVSEGPRPRWAGWGAGAALSAGVLVGFPLTGAALNPARWFGPVLWEMALWESPPGRGPMADVFVYVAGPVLGALLAGLFCFKFLGPNQPESPETANAESSRTIAQPVKVKK